MQDEPDITRINIQFRIFTEENLSDDMKQAIVRYVLNNRNDFAFSPKFYFINVKTTEDVEYEKMVINEFSGP